MTKAINIGIDTVEQSTKRMCLTLLSVTNLVVNFYNLQGCKFWISNSMEKTLNKTIFPVIICIIVRFFSCHNLFAVLLYGRW